MDLNLKSGSTERINIQEGGSKSFYAKVMHLLYWEMNGTMQLEKWSRLRRQW